MSDLLPVIFDRETSTDKGMPTLNSSRIRRLQYQFGTGFLELQQELSDMFEPEKVAHLFRSGPKEPEIEDPAESEAAPRTVNSAPAWRGASAEV